MNETITKKRWLALPSAIYSMYGIFIFLFIFGIIGNSLIIFVYKKREKNSARIFIMSLATVDLLICLIMIPMSAIYVLNNFSRFLVYAFDLLMKYSFSLTCLIFTSISIDRYYALVKPLDFTINEKKAKIILLICNFISLIVVIIMVFIEEFLSFLILYYRLGLFLSCTIIIIVMYSLAFNALRKRSKNVVITNNDSKSSEYSSDISKNISLKNTSKTEKKSKEAIKMAKILLTLTILFVVFYMPYMFQFYIPRSLRIRQTLKYLLFFNNVINFVIYLKASKKFREDCWEILSKLKRN